MLKKAVLLLLAMSHAALADDPGGEFLAREGPGPFEHHVLEQVGDPAPRKSPFVLASGFDPELGGQNRGGVILVEDDSQPVGEKME